MPHKFNAARRHKFDKAQYRVINWAEYNESVRQRGDLTIWVSDEAQSAWSTSRRTSRGGQRRYSDLAIETCLTLRTAYRLGLRQTQGLMGSIGTLMGLDIRVPDFSTLSRCANGLSIAQAVRQAGSVPVHLVVDSTGLKIFGEGEWLAQKHKIKGIRRRWRKLHLGLDLASGAIVCANLTHDDVGDSTALPGLLDQLDAPVTGFLADGAYDGASTRDLLRERYGETLDVVIPPPKNAVTRPQSARDPTVRDRHIAQIRSNGRMAWQLATGYNQRSRIETQIGRWKSVIGPKLKSRSFSRQITEIQVGQKVLNTMTALGRPVFERIADAIAWERANSISTPIHATTLMWMLPRCKTPSMSELFVAPERKRLMVVALLPKAFKNAKGNSTGSKGSRARSEMASSISTAFIEWPTVCQRDQGRPNPWVLMQIGLSER